MSGKISKFKTVFQQKFEDMKEVYFQRLEKGKAGTELKVAFSEDDIDGSIEFYSFGYKEWNLPQFSKIFREEIGILTEQVFFALDKEIKGNKIKVEVKEENLTCFITVKTAPHEKPPIWLFEEESCSQEENGDSKNMFQ